MRSQQDFKYPIVLYVGSPSCSIHDRRFVDPIHGGS